MGASVTVSQLQAAAVAAMAVAAGMAEVSSAFPSPGSLGAAAAVSSVFTPPGSLGEMQTATPAMDQNTKGSGSVPPGSPNGRSRCSMGGLLEVP